MHNVGISRSGKELDADSNQNGTARGSLSKRRPVLGSLAFARFQLCLAGPGGRASRGIGFNALLGKATK